MVISNPKPVCNQNRRTKAIATSAPIPTRCFIGTLRRRGILRTCSAKWNISDYANQIEVVTTNLQIIAKAGKNRLGRAIANADDFEPMVLVSIANKNDVHLAVSTRVCKV